VWLATVLQIGALFLLGMLDYVIACCFLEVRRYQCFVILELQLCYHCMLHGKQCAASKRAWAASSAMVHCKACGCDHFSQHCKLHQTVMAVTAMDPLGCCHAEYG
jgi:hypothetical protein